MAGAARRELLRPLRWRRGALELLDQLALPGAVRWRRCTTEAAVARAIRAMVIRGAPAIGGAAAYGVALAARRQVVSSPRGSVAAFRVATDRALALLAATRPTGVNLGWALGEMRTVRDAALRAGDPPAAAAALLDRALQLHADDITRCQRIGAHGAALLPADGTVLTHCNAGALATGGYGTALGVVRSAIAAGKRIRVVADETRPFLQGARLTAWELHRERIPVTIIPDVAAAALLAGGTIACVVVGADRIAANGDVANKIGTYGVALAAHRHGVPFYVAAPRSTIDPMLATGAAIPIEERAGDEVTTIGGRRIAPRGVPARYPAFDVTPAALVSAIITEDGVVTAPYRGKLRAG